MNQSINQSINQSKKNKKKRMGHAPHELAEDLALVKAGRLAQPTDDAGLELRR
jgi:hypothetical protein